MKTKNQLPEQIVTHEIKDLDGIMEQVIDQMPMHDGEILYKTEIDSQIKLFIFQVMIGLMMVLSSLLIWYRIR